jgi:hypothetical protein
MPSLGQNSWHIPPSGRKIPASTRSKYVSSQRRETLSKSPKSASFSINDPALAGQYTDVLTDESHELEAQESMTMKPWAYRLLEAR